METLAQRLAAARAARDLRQVKLAELAGMKQADISKIETGRILRTTGIGRLASVLGVPPMWLERGVGDPPPWLLDSSDDDGMTAAPKPPQIGGVELLNVSESRDIINPTITSWELLLSRTLPDRFALVVRDDAMPPMRPGDRATFSKDRAPVPGDRVLLADRDNLLYIREYRLRRGDHWMAVAHNPAFQPMDSIDDGLKVLAVQVGHLWG